MKNEIAALSDKALELGATEEEVGILNGSIAKSDTSPVEGLSQDEMAVEPESIKRLGEEISDEDAVMFDETDYSLDQLYPEDQKNYLIKNEKSVKTMAAKSALITDGMDAALGVFNSIIQGEINGDGNEAQKNALQLSKQEAMKVNSGLAASIATDESLSDDEKAAQLQEIANPDSIVYQLNNLLANKAISNPSNFDTAESDEQRVNLSDAINFVNEQRAAVHRIKNGQIAKLDSDTANAVLDFSAALLPFVESTVTQNVYDEFKKHVELKDKDSVFEFLAGNQKVAIREALTNASPDEKVRLVELLGEIVSVHAGTPITGENDILKMQMLEEFMNDGGYGSGSQLIDNVTEVLDLVALGGVVRNIAKPIFRTTGATVEQVLRDTTRSSVRAESIPSSPAKVMQDFNPEGARALHTQMAVDKTDSTAEALYGTNRTDAIADDVLAQADNNGIVDYKVGDLDLEVDEAAIKQLDTGEIQRTSAEKDYLVSKYTDDFRSVKGMEMRREMTQVGDDMVESVVDALPDGVKVKAVYGPPEGGFSNAQDAVDMALWSMRDLGVDESHIKLLQRIDGKYEEVSLADATKWEKAKGVLDEKGIYNQDIDKYKKDYLIQVESKYKFKDSDVGAWSDFDVKNNVFDRIGAAAGVEGEKTAGFVSAIQNYVLDPASMIDPNFFKGASRAVARSAAIEKEILESGGSFALGFSKQPKKRQAVLESIIKEANAKGIDYSNTKAAADGLSPDEILILNDWKRTWNTVYVLENADAVRSLRNTGFKEFVDPVNDSKIFAKPIPKGRETDPKIYDHNTGEVRRMSSTELDELYESGGTLARMKTPTNVDGVNYDILAVPNNKGGSYLRELNENTQAIKYREGYYSVKYKDPYFIDQVFKKAEGTEYSKAVATAASKKEADLLLRRLEAQGKGVYRAPRQDLKGSQIDQDSFDIAQSSGRSTQRLRGERLAGITDEGGIDPSQANIMGPVESMLSSARSVANRASMKQVIDNGKTRFLQQYGDFLPKDAKTNQPKWPTKIEGIKFNRDAETSAKKLGDARTMWNYINYLENGYINQVDDFYKAMLNGLGKVAGNFSSNAEKALSYMAASRGPSTFGKNVAFHAYLALNPFRQLMIQSHQAIQLTANFGAEVATKIPTQVPILTAMQLGTKAEKLPEAMLKAAGLTRDEAHKMYRQFIDSGLVAQIDKQNLIRSGLEHVADMSVQTKPLAGVSGGVQNVLSHVRTAGFDAGENFNMMTSWIAHWNRAKSKGLDVNKADVADDIAAESINYTYNMNAAGDMRYNSDSLALVFQFLQVPHKAFTQMTFNRILTPAQKGKLAAWNLAMYGVPSALVYEMAPQLFPDSPELQHAAVFGMESMLLNAMLNDQVGTETDFSGLAPTGMYGLYETLTGFMTTDLGEIVANTPSGKLFFGSSPRITNAIKTASRAFGISEDNTETPTTFLMAAKDFASIASGLSNAFKAHYMNEFGRTKNGMDLTVTEEDAMRVTFFGLPTADESRGRLLLNKYFKDTKAVKDDVAKFYKGYKHQLELAGQDSQKMEWVVRTHKEAFRVWNQDPVVLETVYKELDTLIRRDVNRKDTGFVDMIVRMSGFIPNDETIAWAKTLPESDAYNKKEVVEMFESLNNLGNE